MHVDSVSAEVVHALRDKGVASILIKGPSVAEWLYGPDRVRSYGDSDLLVAPGDLASARVALRGRGFVPAVNMVESTHASTWIRERDGALVDLHHALWSASSPPQRQFDVLRAASAPMKLAGEQVVVPNLAARALLVAVHAAQHEGPDREKPAEDLRRALAAADLDTWRAADELADALGLVATLAAGLRSDPAGETVALQLRATGMWLRGGPGALGVARLAAASGTRKRARAMAHAAFPSADEMRWWTPLARRGRGGLAAAYVLRAGRLCARTVPSAIAWYRNRSR